MSKAPVMFIQSGLVVIELHRDERNEGFGFSVVGVSSDEDGGGGGGTMSVCVKSIQAGGCAALDGRLKVGDRLLQVDGQSLLGYSPNKVIALLRKAKSTVTISVSRPSSSLLREQRERMKAASVSSRSSCSSDATSDNDDEKNDDDDDLIQSLIDSISHAAGYSDQSDENSDDVMTYEKRTSRSLIPLQPFNPDLIINPTFVHQSPCVEPVGDYRYLQTVNRLVGEVRHKMEDGAVVEEYKVLRDVRPDYSTAVGNELENRSKNRFRNVLPYDHNYVHVDNGSDDGYMNASTVEVEVGEHKFSYIACQGPLPNTIDDFWLMVWQQRIETVMMLTKEVEGGKVKCHCYWPTSTSTPLSIRDKLEVRLVKRQQLDDFACIHEIEMRDMSPSTPSSKHNLYHIHYTAWPEAAGTPHTSLPLLKCLHLITNLKHHSPITIHCTAGIGRTASLILIDIIRHHMNCGKEFDTFALASMLREQRPGMFQTKDQYVFVYEAVLEMLTYKP